ncbi:hypothetical protein H5410_002285 [Solanum commersonii]|uniref:Uncharacterized protein n=1 Tax=Solanum commersonii TaxID=4109 RepID=A0A9J6B1L1_SOLCO|nr:hypothetical protein H5410_002285 [Solanum commersonii]
MANSGMQRWSMKTEKMARSARRAESSHEELAFRIHRIDLHKCGWMARDPRGMARMGRSSAVGHPKGYINICGQVLTGWQCVTRVPIGIVARLVHPTGALDIGLIRDEANVAAQQRASALPVHTAVEAAVVPLASLKLKARDGPCLLHHIHHGCKSRSRVEVRVERRMEDMMDRKVQAINNRLNAFELRVLE